MLSWAIWIWFKVQKLRFNESSILMWLSYRVTLAWRKAWMVVLHCEQFIKQKKGNRVGIILEGYDNIFLEQVIQFNFEISNNHVEYEALIMKLRLARELSVKKINCQSDFQLIIGQIYNDYRAKNPYYKNTNILLKNLWGNLINLALLMCQ